MIVLEGPDGSGKTTLLTHLQKRFPHIDTHERFSTSEGGPVDRLDIKVATDMTGMYMRPPMFYDRHPFISEFIYGPILRGEIKDNLADIELRPYRNTFFLDSLIILCLPPAFVIETNMYAEDQMDGVRENMGAIYNSYHSFLRHQPIVNDNLVWHDYTQHSTEYVEERIENYYNQKRIERGLS